MRIKNLEHLSPDEQMMQLAFESPNPCIAAFPHCIFPASVEALRLVVDTTASEVGIWGNAAPLCGRKGEPYLMLPESDPVADFVLWETPDNQAEALKYGGGRTGSGFVMAIDVRTPYEVLDEMYERMLPLVDTERYDYLTCITLLCEWIKNLRWAYVLLDDEYGHALFVTSRQCAPLVHKVEEALKDRGVSTSRLVKGAGRFHWKNVG